jgi:hypothetical protein
MNTDKSEISIEYSVQTLSSQYPVPRTFFSP